MSTDQENNSLSTIKSLSKILEPEKITINTKNLFERLFPSKELKKKKKKNLEKIFKVSHIQGKNREEAVKKFTNLLSCVEKVFENKKKYLIIFSIIESNRKLKNSLIHLIKDQELQAQAVQYLYYLHRIAIEENNLNLAEEIVDLTKYLNPSYAEELLKDMSETCIEEDKLDGYDAIYKACGRYIIEGDEPPPFDPVHEHMLRLLKSKKAKQISTKKWRLKYDPFYAS